MSVHSKQLAIAGPLGTSYATAFTCPAGYTTIVKWLHVVNLNVAIRNILVTVDTGSGAIELLHRPITPVQSEPFPLWWVLAPGDVLAWRATAVSSINAGLFGTQLLGEPP